MGTKTKKDIWVSGNEAAEVATKNSGHKVDANYIRQLAIRGKIQYRPKNGRENEYLQSDVEAVKVAGKGKNRSSDAGPTERQRRASRKAEREQVLTHE